jgi:hypothetical protein
MPFPFLSDLVHWKSVRSVRPKDRLKYRSRIPDSELRDPSAEQVETENGYRFDHYVCPRCGAGVSFRPHDFFRHVPPSNSPFPATVRWRLRLKTRKRRDRSYLDFACPQCAMPIRIVYEFGVVGKGMFRASVIRILECPWWPRRRKERFS